MARLLVLVLVLVPDLVLVLVQSALLCGAASGSTVIIVKPGEDATLPCQSDVNIRAAEWTRPDLNPKRILFNTDGHSVPTNQHSSFSGRVELVNVTTGNLSLILKNVNRNDSGTYECRVAAGGSRRKKRDLTDLKTIRTVQLQVSASDGVLNRGTSRSRIVLGAAAGLVGLVVVVAVGLFLAWKRKNQPDHRPEPSSEPLSPPAEAVQV